MGSSAFTAKHKFKESKNNVGRWDMNALKKKKPSSSVGLLLFEQLKSSLNVSKGRNASRKTQTFNLFFTAGITFTFSSNDLQL